MSYGNVYDKGHTVPPYQGLGSLLGVNKIYRVQFYNVEIHPEGLGSDNYKRTTCDGKMVHERGNTIKVSIN